MTESQQQTTGAWPDGLAPVVVAVDGSERNQAAVRWAAQECVLTGAPLVLATVVSDDTPRHALRSIEALRSHAEEMLTGLAAELTASLPAEQVATRVLTGAADEVLVTEFPGARDLVLGKRGLGAISRMLVGSTSLAVSGRAHGPVVIVPDKWLVQGHGLLPLVLGVDPYRAPDRLLHLAFRRAERLDVPLIAVHGWETPAAVLMGGPMYDGGVVEWKAEAEKEFEKLMDSWRDRFPHVRLQTVVSEKHPATAVLDAAERAQLVILGRHATSRFTGFAFGSVTRAVLHYAKCPVLVVPTEDTGA